MQTTEDFPEQKKVLKKIFDFGKWLFFPLFYLVISFNKKLKQIKLNVINSNEFYFCKVKSWLMRRNFSGHWIIQ